MTADVLWPFLAPLSDRTILALTLYGEARGEPIEGQIAVACVIRNRVTDTRWPDDYRGVCLQPKQFSCWNDGDPTQAAVIRAAQQAMTSQFDPGMLQCVWIAQGIMDGFAGDVTRGSTNYHADSIPTPSWAAPMILTVKKGHHVFYRAT